jgi:hypothetical protein
MSIKKYHGMAVLFTMAGLSSFAIADEPVNLGDCAYPDALKHGFDMAAYQRCVSKMTQCPTNGPFHDGACIQKNMDKEPSCHQLGLLSKLINASPELIYAQQQAGFTVFDVLFPADGGHLYSLLSPQGCLIDTLVDPRDLSSTVRDQYAKNNFFLEATDKPSYSRQADSSQRFTIDIQAKNQCRGCEVIGRAKIAFDFSKESKWKKTELLSFIKS